MKNKIKQFIAMAFIGFMFLTFAAPAVLAQQGTTNPYTLEKAADAVSKQMSGAKMLVGALAGIIFLAGAVHVVIAFANNSQNLKIIVMAYAGGIIFLGVVYAFIG